MNTILIFSLWAGTPAIAALPADQPVAQANKADDDAPKENPPSRRKQWKILAKAPWSYALPEINTPAGAPQHFVVYSAEELVQAMGLNKKGDQIQQDVSDQLAKAFGAKDIDWDHQMLVVVTGGVQKSDQTKVAVTGLEVQGKKLIVRWKLDGPKPGQPVARKLTHPAQVLLIEKFPGQVEFDREQTSK